MKAKFSKRTPLASGKGNAHLPSRAVSFDGMEYGLDDALTTVSARCEADDLDDALTTVSVRRELGNLDDAPAAMSVGREPGNLDDAPTIVKKLLHHAASDSADACEEGESLQSKHAVPSSAEEWSDLDEDNDGTPTVLSTKKHECVLVRQSDGATHPFMPPCIIGRKSTVDCRIRGNKKISREQARIFKEDGEYLVRDLSSVNGTYVNSSLLGAHEQRAIRSGDVLTMGEEDFVFKAE